MLSFLPREVDATLWSMKVDTALARMGGRWRFWALLKDLLFAVFNGFALGTVDISSLNFSILSLIPKVKGADSIRIFHPIAFINVPFKICVKVFATRLAPVAHHVIHPCQSAFIIHQGTFHP